MKTFFMVYSFSSSFSCFLITTHKDFVLNIMVGVNRSKQQRQQQQQQQQLQRRWRWRSATHGRHVQTGRR